MRRYSLLWCVMAGLAAGCGGVHCPSTLPSADELLQSAAARTQVTSVRAEAKVEQRGPEGRIRGRVMMFMERPDRVRFDAMSQFGPVAILTSDGERFALTELRDKRFTSGPSCPANIARMLGVHLSAEQVLGLLLAELPEGSTPPDPERCRDGRVELARSSAAGGRWLMRFEVPSEASAPRLVWLASEDATGRRQWDVEYEKYREVKRGLWLPAVVRLHDPNSRTRLTVRFKEVDVNAAVPEGAFSQSPRRGLAREEVTCP